MVKRRALGAALLTAGLMTVTTTFLGAPAAEGSGTAPCPPATANAPSDGDLDDQAIDPAPADTAPTSDDPAPADTDPTSDDPAPDTPPDVDSTDELTGSGEAAGASGETIESAVCKKEQPTPSPTPTSPPEPSPTPGPTPTPEPSPTAAPTATPEPTVTPTPTPSATPTPEPPTTSTPPPPDPPELPHTGADSSDIAAMGLTAVALGLVLIWRAEERLARSRP